MADELKNALKQAGLDELPDLGTNVTLDDCNLGCELGCWACTNCTWTNAPGKEA